MCITCKEKYYSPSQQQQTTPIITNTTHTIVKNTHDRALLLDKWTKRLLQEREKQVIICRYIIIIIYLSIIIVFVVLKLLICSIIIYYCYCYCVVVHVLFIHPLSFHTTNKIKIIQNKQWENRRNEDKQQIFNRERKITAKFSSPSLFSSLDQKEGGEEEGERKGEKYFYLLAHPPHPPFYHLLVRSKNLEYFVLHFIRNREVCINNLEYYQYYFIVDQQRKTSEKKKNPFFHHPTNHNHNQNNSNMETKENTLKRSSFLRPLESVTPTSSWILCRFCSIIMIVCVTQSFFHPFRRL